ncbi:protein kinase domain-containing protein [Cryptosporidium felis]|nr:protein kinase domain-containing protein [Cryptosporidium felis]
MTVATSSRRNSRRSSFSSDSSLANHTASSKPKNSYIQKTSSASGGGASHGGYGHKGRSGSGYGSSSSFENRAYLVSEEGGVSTGSGRLEDLASERSEPGSLSWSLSPEVCSLKDYRGFLDCKQSHVKGESMLRRYSGLKSAGGAGNNGGKGIRQVLASIVRGSRASKNRSSSVDSGSLSLISAFDQEPGLATAVTPALRDRAPTNTSASLAPANAGPNIMPPEHEDDSGVPRGEERKELGCVLTGQPIQKAILTQRDLLELRGKIDRVLLTEESFVKSALQSFQQFDLDGDGNLTIEELLDLLTTLGEHLALPPINRKVVANEISIRLNSKITVDTSATESRMLINFPFFLKYYLSVLTTIRQKHFSSGKSNETQQNRAIRKHLVHEDDINDLYTFHYQLGAGTYGEVFLVTENYTRQRRVCKIVDKIKCRRKLDEIDHEVEILKHLDHPGLVHIYEVYEDRLNLYFILEFCPGGNLFHSLQDAIQSGFRFSEYHVSRIIQQVLLAVRYLHLKKVVHKNLKPQNILLTNSFGSGNTSVKLVDFGLAEIFSEDVLPGPCSESAAAAPSSPGAESRPKSSRPPRSLDFTAPELLKGEPFSYSLDLWSVGVVMYSIITGRHPFAGKSHADTVKNICCVAPAVEEISAVSPACKSLLKRLLEKNPRERITVEEALGHDWFSVSHSSYSEVDIGTPLLAHLRAYTKQSELRHVLIHMLSHQLALDTAQINMATSLFRSLDADNDGVLSVSELGTALQKLGISPRESSMIIKAMDVDGNGTVSYSEFISACHIWRQNEVRQLKSFFMKIDRDNDGRISREDFKQLLKAQKSKLLSNITKSFSSGSEVNYRTILPSSNQGVYTEWDSVLDEIDTNRDGLIDWKEFCAFIVDYFNSSRDSLKACSRSSVAEFGIGRRA